MRSRLTALLLIAFLVVSCGTSRPLDSAGGATAGTGDDTAATSGDSTGAADGGSTTTTAAVPVTTAPADEVAASVVYGDGTGDDILHGDLNAVAGPTRANDEFVGLVYGGAVPAGFEAVLLTQTLWAHILDNELAKENTAPSDDDRATAKDLLFEQLSPLLVASPDPAADSERLYGDVPYLPFIVELSSRQIALSNLLAASAAPADRLPCVSHILVVTEEDATQILTELENGADFTTLAQERSIDTGSGAAGGELGCEPTSTYVPEFATAVDSATLGQYVGPVETQFGFHVLIVERYSGDLLAESRLRSGLEAATITIDERIGIWNAENQRVTPAGG